jgi:hypothetical protein
MVRAFAIRRQKWLTIGRDHRVSQGAALGRHLVEFVRPEGDGEQQELRAGSGFSRRAARLPARAPAATARKQPRSAKRIVTALRSLLRFLHVDGIISVPLADAVPSPAGHALAGLPRALEPGHVEAMLASCDFAVLGRPGAQRGWVPCPRRVPVTPPGHQRARPGYA